MRRKYHNWTNESVVKVAKQYSSRTEFQRQLPGAYNYARRNNIFDDVCKHMRPLRKNADYYINNAHKLTKKYSSQAEFALANKNFYMFVRKNKCLDNLFGHLENNVKLSKKVLIEESKAYASRSEFRKKQNIAYWVAYDMGIWNEVCEHMPVIRKRRTIEECINVAKLYSSRIEFLKKDQAVYKTCLRNGWIDEVCEHMSAMGLTYYDVKAESEKYNYRYDFQKGSPSAYNKALKEGWLRDVCSHMRRKKKWTFEALMKEAQKYNSLDDFRKFSHNAYYKAQNEGWLVNISEHMKLEKGPSLVEALKIAKQYSTRTDFNKGNLSTYYYARKNGWLDHICVHMNNKVIWNLQLIKREAAKYKNKEDFRKQSWSAYQAAKDNGWFDDVTSHMQKTIDKTTYRYNVSLAAKFESSDDLRVYRPDVYKLVEENGWLDDVKAKQDKWNFERVALEADKYRYRTDFEQGCRGAYHYAKINDMLDIVCSHMKPKPTKTILWDFESVKKEASKYTCSSDFKEMSSSAASKNNWLDIVCAHMKRKKKWNFDDVLLEAKKYNTRTCFYRGCRGAYDAALKNDWIDQVCKHMIASR